MEPTTIFLHIPKTAGSSLSKVVTGQFRPAETYHIRNPQEVRSPKYAPSFGSVDEFAALDDAEKQRYRCLLGHMNFGLHAVIPQPCRYITLLRDPVERVLSAYHHHQRRLRLDTGDPNASVGLEQFIAERPGNIDHQCRLVSGSRFTQWAYAARSPDEIRQRILSNLENHFSLIGRVERFLDSLALMECELGWSGLSYEHTNAGNRPKSEDEFSADDLAMLRDQQALDLELIEFADRWMNDRISHHGQRFLEARERIQTSPDHS